MGGVTWIIERGGTAPHAERVSLRPYGESPLFNKGLLH